MFEYLSHQRIRQQLERLKERHPNMAQYDSFQDIPERLRVTSCIRAWMAFGARGFSSIPEEYLRDSMVFQGIYEKRLLGFSAYGFKTARYRQMLLFSAWCHASGVLQIPVVYLTPNALQILVKFQTHPLNALVSRPLYEPIFDTLLANAMIAASPQGLMLLVQFPGRFEVATESVIAVVHSSAFCYDCIRVSGTMPILEDMLRAGFWPGDHEHLVEQSSRPGVVWGTRPCGPLEALERMRVVERCDPNAKSSVLPLFTALFNTYSPDHVMHELGGTEDGLSFLFELYSEEEIRRHAKQDRRLRGSLLEYDLGGFTVQLPNAPRRGWR